MLNYFKLFGISPDYFIDKETLEQKYFAAQMQHHPDRASGKSEKEKMELIQKSADINQAYKNLSDDVERANHMLALEGININRESNNAYKPSMALLSEQLEYRERAGMIESGMENKAELLSHFEAEFELSKKDFVSFLKKNDVENAAESAMRLKYLSKLIEEINRLN